MPCAQTLTACTNTTQRMISHNKSFSDTDGQAPSSFSQGLDGLALSRTPETEQAYLDKGKQLWIAARYYAHFRSQYSSPDKFHGVPYGYSDEFLPDIAPGAFVQFHLDRKKDLAPSTWRYYKACMLAWLRFHYADHPDAGQVAASLKDIYVRHLQGCRSKNRVPRKSALRSKRVTLREFTLAIKALHLSGDQKANITAAWLWLGALFGLRPREWRQADIVLQGPSPVRSVPADAAKADSSDAAGVTDAPSHIAAESNDSGFLFSFMETAQQSGFQEAVQFFMHLVDDLTQARKEADVPGVSHAPSGGKPVPALLLRVRNCKTTNGRANSLWRHLDMSAMPDSESSRAALLGVLPFFLWHMHSLDDEQYHQEYQRCSELLRKVNLRILAQHAFLEEVIRRAQQGTVWDSHAQKMLDADDAQQMRQWIQSQISPQPPGAQKKWKEAVKKGFVCETPFTCLPSGWRNPLLLHVYDHYFGDARQQQSDAPKWRDAITPWQQNRGGTPENLLRALKRAARCNVDADADSEPDFDADSDATSGNRVASGRPGVVPYWRIALYTGRHRFASSMKPLMSIQSVAALMGHISGSTTYVYYAGADSSHHSSTGTLRPVQKEVAAIKSVKRSLDVKQETGVAKAAGKAAKNMGAALTPTPAPTPAPEPAPSAPAKAGVAPSSSPATAAPDKSFKHGKPAKPSGPFSAPSPSPFS